MKSTELKDLLKKYRSTQKRNESIEIDTVTGWTTLNLVDTQYETIEWFLAFSDDFEIPGFRINQEDSSEPEDNDLSGNIMEIDGVQYKLMKVG